jgi:hypothetical protein
LADDANDSPIPLPCPECHYEARWFSKEYKFASALDMYTVCPQMTALLDQYPEQREKVKDHPVLCSVMRNVWIGFLKGKV